MEVKRPQDQTYYQILGHAMALTGLGAHNWKWYKYPIPLKESMYKLHAKCIFIYVCVCFSSEVLFLFINFSKLSKTALGAVYSIIPVGLLVNVKVFSAQFDCYGKVVKDYMEKIHLYNYYIRHNTEYVKKKLLQVEIISQIMGISFFISMLGTWFTWTITPFLYNRTNYDAIINGTETFLTCAYMCLPFEYLHDYENWLIANTISIFLSFCAVVLISIFEVLNYMIIFNLIGHIHIMKNNIKTRFTATMSDQEAKRNLVDLIQHHAFITKTFQDVEAAFGLNVAGNYVQNLLEGGILMYQFMLGEKESMLTYGLMIFIYMGGLVVLSSVLEEIRIAAEDLPETLYCSPWEHMSIPNQKTVLLILAKVQPALQFKASGGFRPGVLPALTIIKTTFSYYVMIKSSM